jgi:hypothetical protein
LGDKVLDPRAPGNTTARERLDGRRIFIEHHALVAAARQAANDVPAHASQADHSELHSFTPLIGSFSACRSTPQATARLHQDAPAATACHARVASGKSGASEGERLHGISSKAVTSTQFRRRWDYPRYASGGNSKNIATPCGVISR